MICRTLKQKFLQWTDCVLEESQLISRYLPPQYYNQQPYHDHDVNKAVLSSWYDLFNEKIAHINYYNEAFNKETHAFCNLTFNDWLLIINLADDWLKVYSSYLVLHFYKAGGPTKHSQNQTQRPWLLVTSLGQAPKMLGPTFPIMQLNSVSH